MNTVTDKGFTFWQRDGKPLGGAEYVHLARVEPIPLFIVPPECIPLPKFLCAASLSNMGSRLSIVWFMEKLDRPLQEVIESVVAGVDWAKHALRYEWNP